MGANQVDLAYAFGLPPERAIRYFETLGNGNISQTGLQALKIDTPHLSNRNQGLISYPAQNDQPCCE